MRADRRLGGGRASGAQAHPDGDLPGLRSKLSELEREYRGELEISIPSFQAFNRYSLRLATLTQRLNDTREIAATLAEKFDASDSDNLTLIAAEAIKTLVFELVTNSGEAGFKPKEAMSLAAALRSATQAQQVSTVRRSKIEKDLATMADKAVDAVKKAGAEVNKEDVLRLIREAIAVRHERQATPLPVPAQMVSGQVALQARQVRAPDGQDVHDDAGMRR